MLSDEMELVRILDRQIVPYIYVVNINNTNILYTYVE